MLYLILMHLSLREVTNNYPLKQNSATYSHYVLQGAQQELIQTQSAFISPPCDPSL